MRLEDKEGSAVVKLVGKEAILRERERERQVSGSLGDLGKGLASQTYVMASLG